MSKKTCIEVLTHRVELSHEYAGQAHERCTVMEYAVRGFDSRLKALESAQPQQGEGGNSAALATVTKWLGKHGIADKVTCGDISELVSALPFGEHNTAQAAIALCSELAAEILKNSKVRIDKNCEWSDRILSVAQQTAVRKRCKFATHI